MPLWGAYTLSMATLDLARRAEIGREKRARTRDAIIQSALDLIDARGFDGPTIDEFIGAAGVAKGTFYNHFKTKEELAVAAAAHVADAVDAVILNCFEGVDDPAQRVAIAVQQFIFIGKRRPAWGWVLVRTATNVHGAWSTGMFKGMQADIRSGQRLGRFHVASEQAALAIAMGALSMSILRTLSGRTPAAFAEIVAAMLLQALGVSLEEAQRVASLPLPKG